MLKFIKVVFISFACLIGCCMAQAQTKVPTKIVEFIPEGYELLAMDSNLIEATATTHFAVVLKKHKEGEDLRPLLFIVRNAAGKHILQFRNDSAVYTTTEGPYPGDDCFSGIRFENETLRIDYYGGMSTRWSEAHHFGYDHNTGQYILSKLTDSNDNIYDDIPAEENEMGFENKNISLKEFSVFRHL